MPKNISSHQDIWIIFTYLFGQSNDCIMMPKKNCNISNKKASYPSRMRLRIISEFLKVKKKKKTNKKKNIKKLILDFY